MTYQQLDVLLQGRCQLKKRICAGAFWVRDGESICLEMYGEIVAILYRDGRIELRLGGASLGVKYRVNKELLRSRSFMVFHQQGVLILYRYRGTYSKEERYSLINGTIIDQHREVSGEAPESVIDQVRRKRRVIAARNRRVRVQTCALYLHMGNFLTISMGDVLREQRREYNFTKGEVEFLDKAGAPPLFVTRIMHNPNSGSYWIHTRDIGTDVDRVFGPWISRYFRHDQFLSAASAAIKGDDNDSLLQADSNRLDGQLGVGGPGAGGLL